MSATAPERVAIAPATEADLPAISQLAGVIWRACYPAIISSEQIDYMLARMYALDTMREEIHSLGVRYALMSVAGKMVGFASCGPTSGPGVMKLHKLYLLPELQGRGLGSRLLQHCEQETRRLGARQFDSLGEQAQRQSHRRLPEKRFRHRRLCRHRHRRRVCHGRFHHGEGIDMMAFSRFRFPPGNGPSLAHRAG